MKKILIDILIPIVPRDVLFNVIEHKETKSLSNSLSESLSIEGLYFQIYQKIREYEEKNEFSRNEERERQLLILMVDYRLFVTWGDSDLDFLRNLSKKDLLDLLENPSYYQLSRLKLDFILNIPGLKILENYGLPEETLSIFPDLFEKLDQRVQSLVDEHQYEEDQYEKNSRKRKDFRISTGNIINGGKSIGAIWEESFKMTKSSSQKELLKLIFARFIQTQLYHYLLDCPIDHQIINSINLDQTFGSEFDHWKSISIYIPLRKCQKSLPNHMNESRLDRKYKLISPNLDLSFSNLGLMIQGNLILNYICWKLLDMDRFEPKFQKSFLSHLSSDLIKKLSLCEDLPQVLSISLFDHDYSGKKTYSRLRNKIYQILRQRFFLQIYNSLGNDKYNREISLIEKYFQVDPNYGNCLLLRSLRKKKEINSSSSSFSSIDNSSYNNSSYDNSYNTPERNKLFSLSRFREGLALRLRSYPEIKNNLVA